MTTYDADELRRLARDAKRADHCHGIVTRSGEEDACGKTPVAVMDDEEGGFWPACAYHANRWSFRGVVPLAMLVAALREVEEVADASVVLDRLADNLQAAHMMRAPWRVRAALVQGAAVVLEALDAS